MTIKDPIYVLQLWASSVRPSVRRLRPKGYEKPGQGDDRRWQARVRVESTPGFFKARPLLWIEFVNGAQIKDGEAKVIEAFVAELGSSLADAPILIDEAPRSEDDFLLPVEAAVAKLADSGIHVSERTIRRWADDGLIGNTKQGRVRLVRWSEVVLRAPKRKRKKCA